MISKGLEFQVIMAYLSSLKMKDFWNTYLNSDLFSDAPLVSAVPPKVSCLAGYRVALTCSVLSVPKPDVQWFFNRRQLKMDAKHTMEERGDNYTLTVADVRQQDLGEYTCSAVNKIGEAQATVLLTGKKKKIQDAVSC